MSYQARWPLGIALGLVFFEGLACSAGGGSAPDNPYGGGAGTGAGASSGSGQGATGGAGPGGSAGDAGASGAGNNTGTGGGGAGPGGTGGDGGVSGTNGIGGDGGTGALPPFDGGTDPNRNNVQPGQVCERLATIQCAAEVSCCGAPGRDFDQCKQAQLNTCRNEAYLDAVSANPMSGFDMGRAAAAFAEFERLASMCDPAIVQWAISANGLRGIVLGTRNPNDSCFPTGQTDNRPVVAAHLASCKDSATQSCLPLRLLAWECRPRNPAGGDCFSDLNCVDGVYCNNPNLEPLGSKCAQRKPENATCVTSNECASLFCRGGRCIPPSAGAAYCLAIQ